VDFAYEVNRSLAACEGSLLVVDASQGVEAQTLANVYQAIENDHEIVPVLNKIDLPAAEPDRIKQQIEDVIGWMRPTRWMISAKTGIGIRGAGSHRQRLPRTGRRCERAAEGHAGRQLVRRLSRRDRAGAGDRRQAEEGQRSSMMGTDATYDWSTGSACSRRKQEMVGELGPGEIGFMTARSRKWPTPASATPSPKKSARQKALPGFKPAQPVVFCGSSRSMRRFRRPARRHGQAAPERCELLVRDGNSAALGFGFRCGFLGLLHLEIIQERLEREFDLDLITTAPSVVYDMSHE
jgi:GTP-binding protein LepA